MSGRHSGPQAPRRSPRRLPSERHPAGQLIHVGWLRSPGPSGCRQTAEAAALGGVRTRKAKQGTAAYGSVGYRRSRFGHVTAGLAGQEISKPLGVQVRGMRLSSTSRQMGRRALEAVWTIVSAATGRSSTLRPACRHLPRRRGVRCVPAAGAYARPAAGSAAEANARAHTTACARTSIAGAGVVASTGATCNARRARHHRDEERSMCSTRGARRIQPG